jgi:osmotically-inducible protein OsmY
MTYKTDEQIKQEVERELRWDSRVSETEVGVTVHKGVVTLTGTIDSYAKKLAAQEAAHRVHGVLDVANDLQVKLPGTLMRNDTEIAQAVRRALEWNVLVPDERIQSTVANGWVTLTGTVDNLREREDAERAVRYLLGVRGVYNKLVVLEQAIEPDEVRSIIEEALERRADREAKRIQVSVSNGAVTLSGTVRSWAEKRAIAGAVSHAPGVNVLHDELRIDPYQAAAAAY